MKSREIANVKVWGKMETVVVNSNNMPKIQPRFFVGDNADIFGTNGKFILVSDLANIQNSDVFEQGLDYIAKYASPKNQQRILNILTVMQDNPNKDSEEYCANVAFICDLGLWKNKALCIKSLWHKDFPKYMSNLFWNYEKVLFA